ncbi:DHA2 family efflux MFS transporter permease subunit [Mycetocola sp.]|uniref:DHA2 family efflux MFS transporter permease subunit n=1 Tax=Mycetocola sp. TaxID=1871042 RepID=UPI00398A38A1
MNDSTTDLTLTEHTSTLRSAEPDHTARNFRVIWLMLAATFVVILNETIMGVALRELMLDLDISARSAQWLTTAFLLTMAIVIPVTGFLLQRFHTRPIFITAMSLFSAGTLLAALAPNFEVLLGARVVQASGTAIMIPLLMTTIMTLVPVAQRGRTMGNVSIVISVAPAIGPTVSGIILNALSWRWMFWIVLPIALVMLVIGIRRVENVTEPKRVPLDVVSVILSAFGFGGLIYGLSRIGESGPENATAAEQATAALPMWVALGVGVIGLGWFIARQLRLQRSDRALLDLRTFRSANFSVSIGVMVVSMAALFGTIILLPIYMQQVLGLEPVQTGLLLLPGGLLMGLLAPFVGRLYDRFGPKPLLIPGSIVVSAALWALATVGESTSPLYLLGAHLLLSLGLAFLFTPLFTSALGSVQPHLYAHASATVGTVQQVAGAAGTALFVTIMSTTSAALASDGIAGGAAAAGGIRSAFLVGAFISLLAIVGAIFVSKPADAPAGVPAGH